MDYKELDLQDYDVVIITEAHLSLLEHRLEFLNAKYRRRGEVLERRPRPALVIAINQAQLDKHEMSYIHSTGFQSVRAREQGTQMKRPQDLQLINELNIDNERRRVAEYCRQDKKRNKVVARRINKNPVLDELIKNAEQLPKPKMLSLDKRSQPDQVYWHLCYESAVCYPTPTSR